MKLRTRFQDEDFELGEVVDGVIVECLGKHEEELRVIAKAAKGGQHTFYYSSIKKFMNDWEDYKPAEPLIKDEKIRKAVRAWAEANGLKNVAFEDYDDENCYFIDRDYEPQIWFSKKSMQGSSVDDGKIYSIAELCGEEEE